MSTTLLFVGGGLANGLAALRLSQQRPDVSFTVVEAGPTLGGNHTWSFHDADLTAEQRSWIAPLISRTWDGTDVLFPDHRRTLTGRYHSVLSTDFHHALMSSIAARVITDRRAVTVTPTRVTLDDGGTMEASAIIDGRGWMPPAGSALGWQKFVGLDLTLAAPHGLTRPVIMDATVTQLDGFRFFYLLPWDATHVLIEDTRYSDTPILNQTQFVSEISAYAAHRGWTIASRGRMEAAALPIPLEGSVPAVEPGLTASGLRSGLFHPTTGYSFPDAVRFADELAVRPSFAAADLAAWSSARAHAHWQGGRFFRLLNRLMFRASVPERRYRILENFYRRNEGMIERFYAGRLTGFDRLRILSGRPPVPLAAALKTLVR